MPFPLVYIIILNLNGLRDTLDCLESLKKLEYPNKKIIVVDNGSTDGSAATLKTQYPELILIENKINLGYAKGNNIGIKWAIQNGGDYIWLLNNDTIVDSRALINLVQVAEENPSSGIVGSKIYQIGNQKRIWFAGATINWGKGLSSHLGINEIDMGQYNKVRVVDRVAGCSMLVKKKVCEEVGLLDENYFLYVEEVDWCVRARKHGFKILFVPTSIIFHKLSATVSKIGPWETVYNYYNTRNFLYLTKKSFSFPKREFYLFQSIARKVISERANLIRILLQMVQNDKRITVFDYPVLFGIRDFLVNRMGEAHYFYERGKINRYNSYCRSNEAS